MTDFKDERAGTETCHKLDCGHAFHTKCIIDFLTKTESKCPCCNNHKTLDQKLTEAGRAKNILKEIQRSEQFKAAKNEAIQSKEEYLQITKQLKSEAKVWIANRATELKLHEHKAYYFKTITACKKAANDVSKSLGAKHIGALMDYTAAPGTRRQERLFEDFIFGKQRWWQVYRLKHPRFYMNL